MTERGAEDDLWLSEDWRLERLRLGEEAVEVEEGLAWPSRGVESSCEERQETEEMVWDMVCTRPPPALD